MGVSLCESCDRVREVLTPRGSRFLLCRLSAADPTYPKYPRQPVVRCRGYRRGEGSPAERGASGDDPDDPDDPGVSCRTGRPPQE